MKKTKLKKKENIKTRQCSLRLKLAVLVVPCPIFLQGQLTKTGCRSSTSHDTFRCELLRQAMADRSRLKASRALNQAIVVQ